MVERDISRELRGLSGACSSRVGISRTAVEASSISVGPLDTQKLEISKSRSKGKAGRGS